ncbi:hypothetical protein ACFE04_003250 [Oxalis oulophora]
MGNCLRHGSSSAVWAGDDWGSLLRNDEHDEDIPCTCSSPSSSSKIVSSKSINSSNTEVKIRMTKKELEKLLSEMHIKGLSLEQVLMGRMVNGGDQRPPWKPALLSIPEVN